MIYRKHCKKINFCFILPEKESLWKAMLGLEYLWIQSSMWLLVFQTLSTFLSQHLVKLYSGPIFKIQWKKKQAKSHWYFFQIPLIPLTFSSKNHQALHFKDLFFMFPSLSSLLIPPSSWKHREVTSPFLALFDLSRLINLNISRALHHYDEVFKNSRLQI